APGSGSSRRPCQKASATASIGARQPDRRYGLMADPKSVVERHIETFNARDTDASPWSEDADFVAPNASMHGRDEVIGFSGVFWEGFSRRCPAASPLLAGGCVVAAAAAVIGRHPGAI